VNKTLFSAGDLLPFRLSKVALNMWNKTMSQRFKDISFVVTCPGWLKTGQELNADLKPEQAAFYLLRVVEKIRLEHSGFFFDLKMKELPY